VGIEDHYSNLARDQSLSIQQLTAMLAAYTGPPGYDPKPALQSLSVPALFVYGGMDRSNPTFHDIPQVEAIKSERGKDFTVLLFPNTNHDLFDVTTGSFDPQLFPSIIAWARTKLRAPGEIGSRGQDRLGRRRDARHPPGALSADTVILRLRARTRWIRARTPGACRGLTGRPPLRVPATLTLPFDPTRTPAGLRSEAGCEPAGAGDLGGGRIDWGRRHEHGFRKGHPGGTWREAKTGLGSLRGPAASTVRLLAGLLGLHGRARPARTHAGCRRLRHRGEFRVVHVPGPQCELLREGTGKWYQTYVGNDGVLVIEGTFVGGRMVLYQNPVTATTGGPGRESGAVRARGVAEQRSDLAGDAPSTRSTREGSEQALDLLDGAGRATG
jgi:hypothetical protein